MTRILVGTLKSLENEFSQCCAALRGQTLRTVEHFVIEGLPKREAHDALFRSFMGRATEFDLFLKLDADMVLTRPTVLAEIADWFKDRPTLRLLTVGVRDFFSGRLINGLHTFRSDVTWPLRDNVLFTDTHNVPRAHVHLDFVRIAPAALHCPDPTPFQAFHFGIHRGLKIRAALSEGRSTYVRIHSENLDAVWWNYRRAGDRRIGWAALGAELAIQGEFQPEHIPYTNPHAERMFWRRYASLDDRSLDRRLRLLRVENRVRHPRLLFSRVVAALRRRLKRATALLLTAPVLAESSAERAGHE